MTREQKQYFVRTKFRWLELLAEGYTKVQLARIAGVSRRTLRRWEQNYARYGDDGLVPQPKRPRSCPRQTPRDMVELIRQLRCSRPRSLGPIPISVKLRKRHGITHYLIDAGKPQQNGRVERSHRTDQEELYDVERFASLPDLRRKQQRWLEYYNHEREHQGIGNLTPFEKFREFADNAKVA